MQEVQVKVFVVGGTGFLGYHSILVGLERGHSFGSLALDDIPLGGWFPVEVALTFGDVFAMSEEALTKIFAGSDALIYAVGPDDRVVPPAPAYEFFHARLVDACEKTVAAARKAGVKRCVILNSYFAYFDRIWPEKKLAARHPYIRCRVEQAERAVAAGGDTMDVMILELPYIFGSMPLRVPIWKDVILDRFAKGRVVFFPKGGTNMLAVRHVGEAVIGALERGRHGARYPVGDENHTFKEMLELLLDAKGTPKKIMTVPGCFAQFAGIFITMKYRRKGLESGLDIRYLLRDIMSEPFYFDPEESAKALGYGRGGLKEAIEDTIRACYPKN
jgi:nucleoside-diphosphate-sugar epimerase